MRIIALAGSNSKNSINKRLSKYVSSLFEDAKIDLLDLNNYEVELYSIDKEIENGIPSKIKELAQLIDETDLLVLSLAEHNGTYSAAFKNVYDWLSRIQNRHSFGAKPILLMASSTGRRGGLGVLEAAIDRFPRDGSKILDTFSLPSFDDNFYAGEIINIKFKTEIVKKVNTIKFNHFNLHYKDDSFTCG
jgi:NAD(P)H-dependent FMN reductase